MITPEQRNAFEEAKRILLEAGFSTVVMGVGSVDNDLTSFATGINNNKALMVCLLGETTLNCFRRAKMTGGDNFGT